MKILNLMLLTATISMFSSLTAAQNKVVVIPMFDSSASAPIVASGQLVGGGTSFNSFGNESTNFIPMNASGRTNDYDGSKTRIAISGTLTDLYASASDDITSGSYTLTLIKNGAGQSLTCTIIDPNVDCTDLSNCVDLVVGDFIAFQAVGSGATNRALKWNGVFTPGASCP